MKATSLSINLFGGCNARCPFCIASATWKTGIRSNKALLDSVPRALYYAKYHGVDTVLITGSGEPTLQRTAVLKILQQCNVEKIPITELQTNGEILAKDSSYLDDLKKNGLNTIAISIASIDEKKSAQLMAIDYDYTTLAKRAFDSGFVCRISLNMTAIDRNALLGSLPETVDSMRSRGVHQLTLRELGIPAVTQPTKEAKEKIEWIRDNALPRDDVRTIIKQIEDGGVLLRRLSYGAAVYDYRGLSVCVASCLTEKSDPNEIRSLILMPDGHVYHSWNYRGSILL